MIRQAALSLVLISVFGVAQAQDVPDISGNTYVQGRDENLDGSVINHYFNQQGSPTSVSIFSTTATTTGGSVPSAYAEAGPDGMPYSYFTASADIEYYFKVVGPSSPLIDVPVIISAQGSVSDTVDDETYGNPSASSGVYIQPNYTNPAYTVSWGVNTDYVTHNASFNMTRTFQLTAGEVTLIDVFALAGGGMDTNPYTGQEIYTGSATAFADPVVTIDPTFLAANPGYSLEFSAGAAAPEPSALALFGLGSMMLLIRLRKGR